MDLLDFGGGRVWTGEPFQAHDFIPLSPKTKAVIFEKCAPLYEKGLSIRDIEEATGIPKSTIRVALTSGGMSLRNPTNGNARKILQLRHEGQTFQAIADELNNKNITTRSGKPWIRSVVSSIILKAKKK